MAALLPISAELSRPGSLSLAGWDVQTLANQWGTPLYIYDEATLQYQVERLRADLAGFYPGEADITYAAKAYFSLEFARRLAGMHLGVDVVSRSELEVARRAGFAAGKIHLHGNNKTETELRAAIELGVQAVVIDSLDELDYIESLARGMGQKVRAWLRITPGIAVNTHTYRQTAHPASKFGLPIADGQAETGLRQALSSPWIDLTGLHTHLGSQLFEAQPYAEALRSMLKLADACDFIPREISPGGGWGVPYTDFDPEDDPAPWVETVAKTLVEECALRKWPLPKMILEPGRWLAARAGLAIYTIGAVKTAMDGTRMAAVDGGLGDNPRPELYQSAYTAYLLPQTGGESRQDMDKLEDWAIVGRYCENGDQLIRSAHIPQPRRGDRVVIPVSGAYHLSMASNYNLVPRPAVLWVGKNGVEVLQKREEFETSAWWLGK